MHTCNYCGKPLMPWREREAWRRENLLSDEQHYTAAAYNAFEHCPACQETGEETLAHKRALKAAFFAANPQLEGWRPAAGAVWNLLEVASPRMRSSARYALGAPSISNDLFDHDLTWQSAGRPRRVLVLGSLYTLDNGVCGRLVSQAADLLRQVRERDYARSAARREKSPWPELVIQMTPRRLAWWHAAGNLTAVVPADLKLNLDYPWPSPGGQERDGRWHGSGVDPTVTVDYRSIGQE